MVDQVVVGWRMLSFLKRLLNPAMPPRDPWPALCTSDPMTFCIDHDKKEQSRCINGCHLRKMAQLHSKADDWMRY